MPEMSADRDAALEEIDRILRTYDSLIYGDHGVLPLYLDVQGAKACDAIERYAHLARDPAALAAAVGEARQLVGRGDHLEAWERLSRACEASF
jgi:hypothetical protein